jgi:[ribosomal protein S5]-alanine N-acetyltransferase
VHYTALPILTHPLATLRELRADDLPPWFAILSQPAVYEHTSWDLASAEDLRAYAAQERAPSTLARFALAHRGDGRLIGSAGFHTVQAAHRSAEMAYDLDPAFWGQGLARAACQALCAWAFEHVGLQRVQASTLTTNLRSQRVLEACGFEREGLLRRYRIVRGQPGDFWMYARLG